MPAQRDLPVATELLRTRISICCGSASCSSEATRAVLSADTNVATDIAPAAAPVEHPPPNQLVTELVPCACRLSVGQGCAALAEVPIHASAERRRRALCATCLEHVGSEVCSCECGSCLQPDINYEADEDEINNIDIHELGFRMASSADEVEDSIERALAERAALLPPAPAQALRATPFRTAILPQNHATRSPTAVYDLRDPKPPPSPPASPPETSPPSSPPQPPPESLPPLLPPSAPPPPDPSPPDLPDLPPNGIIPPASWPVSPTLTEDGKDHPNDNVKFATLQMQAYYGGQSPVKQLHL